MSDNQPTKPATPAYRTLIPAGGASLPSGPAKPAIPVKPEPATAEAPKDSKDNNRPDPTRFGDWEIKGRCIDF
jgi:hypothetical protein